MTEHHPDLDECGCCRRVFRRFGTPPALDDDDYPVCRACQELYERCEGGGAVLMPEHIEGRDWSDGARSGSCVKSLPGQVKVDEPPAWMDARRRLASGGGR